MALLAKFRTGTATAAETGLLLRTYGELGMTPASRSKVTLHPKQPAVASLWDAARIATAAERARAEQAETEREAARAQGEMVAIRGQVQAERDVATARVQAAEAARDAARAELAGWTSGGPLGRAWRALVYRRGRP